MKSPDVHHYNNARQYLMDALAARQAQDAKFSVRLWAKEMGSSSHTLLSLLLLGKRPLRLKHVSMLNKSLKLDSRRQLYLQALIQLQNASTPEELELCSRWLEDLNPGQSFKTRELEEFAVISHWLYTAILVMTHVQGFDGSDAAIHRRLKHRGVSLHEIRPAIERLMSLGLLKRLPDGRLEMAHQNVTSRNDVASAGARKYHRQALELAAHALDAVPLDKREFQSMSVAVSRDKLIVAKDMIRDFRARFIQAMGEAPAHEVCQLNIQFFQLTRSPQEKRPHSESQTHA